MVEVFPCNNKDELLAREGYHQRLNWDNIANVIMEKRTTKEYLEDNKEMIAEKQSILAKKYRENNAEKLKEYEKERHLTEERQEWRKNYQEENREYNNERQLKANQENIIDCDCGVSFQKINLPRHVKSKGHLKYLESIKPDNNLEEIEAKKKEDERQKRIEYQKKYREENNETLLEKKKEYYIENKESIKEYKIKYRAENLEKMQEKSREYTEKNKDVIIDCECGVSLKKANYSKHKKSMGHIKYMESK